ncbi:MAG: hypothetical protein AAGH88_15815 [Planctomycetota bacterium]
MQNEDTPIVNDAAPSSQNKTTDQLLAELVHEVRGLREVLPVELVDELGSITLALKSIKNQLGVIS